MNESNPGALGIPECMPPVGGETFKVNLHAPTSERTTMNESNPGALGITEFRSPAAMNFHSNPKWFRENDNGKQTGKEGRNEYVSW
jgi:hypothetical protein